MARAGYCRECGENVWVGADGACLKAGHPAASISAVYDADASLVDAPPAAQPAQPRHRTSRFVILGIVVAVLALVGLCAVAAAVVGPLANKGSGIAKEWQARLAKDYPGWKTVGFNVRSFSGPDGSEAGMKPTQAPLGNESHTIPLQSTKRKRSKKKNRYY